MPRKSKHNHLATAIDAIMQEAAHRHESYEKAAVHALLDLIVAQQTGFSSFDAMVAPNQGNYVPTIEVGGITGWEDRLVLAYFYDTHMKDSNDDRRAYRMGFDQRKLDLTVFGNYRVAV